MAKAKFTDAAVNTEVEAKAAVAKAYTPSITLKSSAADVAKAIESIKNRGARLDADIHAAACAALAHIEKSGDYTLINRLLLAMPKSSRRNSLAVWACAFATLVKNEGGDKSKPVETFPLIKGGDKVMDVAGAVAKPFWEFKNVKEGTDGFKFDDYIGGVMKKLAAIAADTKSADAAAARATLHALSAVREAAALPPPPTVLEEGQPAPARRASDRVEHAAPAAVQ